MQIQANLTTLDLVAAPYPWHYSSIEYTMDHKKIYVVRTAKQSGLAVCSNGRIRKSSNAMAQLRGSGPWYESFHIILIGCFSLPLGCWLLHSKQSASNSNVGHRTGRTALRREYSKFCSKAATCLPTHSTRTWNRPSFETTHAPPALRTTPSQ
jgi:hypothetical protein